MEPDNRIYRLTDKKEIDAFVEQYGSKFLQFKADVYTRLKGLPSGTFFKPVWIDIFTLVKKEHLLSAFIKCACLFMLENNTIKEFWEFDDHYLHIRHIKEDPEKEINYSAIQRWYEKK